MRAVLFFLPTLRCNHPRSDESFDFPRVLLIPGGRTPISVQLVELYRSKISRSSLQSHRVCGGYFRLSLFSFPSSLLKTVNTSKEKLIVNIRLTSLYFSFIVWAAFMGQKVRGTKPRASHRQHICSSTCPTSSVFLVLFFPCLIFIITLIWHLLFTIQLCQALNIQTLILPSVFPIANHHHHLPPQAQPASTNILTSDF